MKEYNSIKQNCIINLKNAFLKFVFIILVNNCSSLYSQVKVLENLKPDSCNYKFYFQSVQMHIDTIINDSMQTVPISGKEFPNFVIDNKETIRRFIDNWTGEVVKGMYWCWYNYFIYITCENKIIDVLKINYKCKQVVTQKRNINFKSHPFNNLDTSKQFDIYNFSSKSLAKSRKFLERAKLTQGIFIPELSTYNWSNYAGEFFINIKIDTAKKDLKIMINIQMTPSILNFGVLEEMRYRQMCFVIRNFGINLDCIIKQNGNHSTKIIMF